MGANIDGANKALIWSGVPSGKPGYFSGTSVAWAMASSNASAGSERTGACEKLISSSALVALFILAISMVGAYGGVLVRQSGESGEHADDRGPAGPAAPITSTSGA